MPGIEIKGRSKRANYRHGGRTRLWHGGTHNTGRTNLLEQLGRVEGERSNPNRRAEISRVHGELNRGYAKGGRAGFKHGTKKSKSPPKGRDPGREPRGTTRKWIRATPTMAAEGGRIGLKEGTDKKWIQKATKGMVKTKPCTGKKFGSKSCPPGSRRYNLAKTFKKMGRERKAEA
jgi:hypothetical protein